jgi:non-heme chloroperoxidase
LPTVSIDGGTLFYEERGAGETIVFSHGIPTDYRAWSNQMEPFSKKFRAVAYSRRYAAPNNRSGDLKDSTVQNNAEDLRILIESFGKGAVHLVGHSYGGFIAAFFAARHPELVTSLILVEPAVSTLLVEDASSRGQMFSLLLRSPSVALSANRFQGRSLKPSLKELDEGQLEKAVELNVDGVQDMSGAYRALPQETRKMMLDNARTIAELRTTFPPFRNEAPKVSAKTLVVNGQESALWLRRIGDLTAAAIPKAKGVKVAKSRHFPHFENPSEFNPLCLGFLTGT